MPASRRALIALRVAAGVLAGLLAAEALFHVGPVQRTFGDRYRENFYSSTPPWPIADRWRSDAPRVGVRMRPHWKGELVYPFGTHTFETNRDGFAFADLPYEKPPGVTRIAMYGNSVLLSKEIPFEARIPTRLEQLLRAEGLAVEVLNFAVDNTEMDNWIMYHREYGRKYAPDVVVIVTPRGRAHPVVVKDPATGAERLFSELKEPPRYSTSRELIARLSTKVRLFTVGARVVGELRHSHSPAAALTAAWRFGARREENLAPPDSATVRAEAAETLRAWQLFAEEARRDGTQQVLTTWVQSPKTWNRTGGETLRYAELERLAAAQAQPAGFVPLFANHALDGRPESDWYIPRFNHFHAAGADEAARWLVPHVRAAIGRVTAARASARALENDRPGDARP